jgi:predicted transcriptional regulator
METILTIRITNDLKKSLQKLADADRRKLSDFVRVQLEILVESKKVKK